MSSNPQIFASGEPLQSFNPVTQDISWQGRTSLKTDVDRAVTIGLSAFKTWSKTRLEKRIQIARRFADLVDDQADDLARQISEDTGKALWDSKTEINAVVGKTEISIRALEERTGIKETNLAAGRLRITHRPHGVMAVLGPFNFPAHLPNGHIVPALLAGNTVVFKPSEQAPKIAEALARCWKEAGLPAGVLSLVFGTGEVGRVLVEHDKTDGVLFTGGVPAGIAIHKALAGQPQKILALELGGNNPLVAWDLQDIDAAAQIVAFSAFVSAGQRCTCARRLIIPNNDKGEELVREVRVLTRKLGIGDPFAEDQPFMGSLISADAVRQVLKSYDTLKNLGGKPIVRPSNLEAGDAFVTPGLIDMTDVSDVPDEEIFGPILQIYRVDTFAQALEQANNTKFGLAASLLSDNSDLFEQFSQEVRAGIINWNKPTAGASSAAPFGGVGLSGNHRPAGYYSADYCAFPIASLTSELRGMKLMGIS